MKAKPTRRMVETMIRSDEHGPAATLGGRHDGAALVGAFQEGVQGQRQHQNEGQANETNGGDNDPIGRAWPRGDSGWSPRWRGPGRCVSGRCAGPASTPE